MRIPWKKILFWLLKGELFALEIFRLLIRELPSLKKAFRKQLTTWSLKLISVIFLVLLAYTVLLFGLVGLALYFNVWLGSSYQGFLLVAGGSFVFLLLVWLLCRVR